MNRLYASYLADDLPAELIQMSVHTIKSMVDDNTKLLRHGVIEQ